MAKDANVKVAARRIMWGKCMNTGQTCIAPDYVLCMRDQKDKLVDELKKTVKEFYGEVSVLSLCAVLRAAEFFDKSVLTSHS